MKTNLRRTLAGTAALAVGLAPAAISSGPAMAAPHSARTADTTTAPANYDARQDPAVTGMLHAKAATLTAQPPASVSGKRSELGDQGIVDLDPLTGTPRQVARLDGFLTGPSRKPAVQVARDYLKAHADLFGVDPATLKLRRDYVDIEGTHHLSFLQRVGDVPVFGNGIRADVARNGALIQMTGSPVRQMPASLAGAKLTAVQALDTARRDARETRSTVSDKASLVAFPTVAGLRLGYQTLTMQTGYLHVIDAQNGRVLYRQSLTDNDAGPDALVWDNYPGAPAGGKQRRVSLSKWMSPHATNLTGNSAHVFSDLNDNNAADAGEEVGPSSPGHFRYPLKQFTGELCSAQFQCTWNPFVAFSWNDNREMDATQLLYFNSVFHDHLLAAPIGFTRAAGNFETRDGDAVQVNDLDGANTDNGFPDGNHVDNANMSTPPDGTSPTMQMYLQPAANTPAADDPYVPSDVGNEASSVYHEYTHGLSNRLVVDAAGVSTLNGPQSGAMGEAWSDWYAYDYLQKEGLERDTAKPGELVIFEYSTAGANTIRTEPLDCTVGAPATVCPGTPTAGPGGYTYGDFGRISRRGPEVHADGEIWAQTLWDLRTKLGYRLSESLVTRAMELSPADPSYLDMRNSILMADLVVAGGRHQRDIWKVFANRGMGFFAAAVDGSDTAPVEDFSTPPSPHSAKGTIAGTVTDQGGGQPAAGVAVTFGGHSSGFAGSYAAVTGADGRYQIKNVFVGTYPKVAAGGAGFESQVKTVTVTRQPTTVDWSVRRDWAASQGGATVADFNGDDYSGFGCGPGQAIDMSQGSGWSSDAVITGGTAIEPRFVTIQLPAAVDLRSIEINPTGNCGDDPSASAGDYRVETSADGAAWTVAASGHFGPADRDRMNPVTLSAGTAGVRFVRYTMLGTQVADEGGSCPSQLSGCSFVDTVEVGVYGAAG
ncbi:M36 family metallopeptidase [Actinoplanes sp. NPDC051513]|uniref:M36 family metallopeptidase n=1 Tax=Actinoplanes sp. NPDC051513 TaxID=3363908 RepID=UPI003788DA21